MKLKTRSVTILTDDEVALVSGGLITRYTQECSPTQVAGGCWETWPECNDTYPYTETLVDCPSRECDPYETQTCTINVCLDTEAQCNTEACE